MYPLAKFEAKTAFAVRPDARSLRSRKSLQLKGLPEAQFEGLSAGRGSRACCEGCGYVIADDETEFELRFRQDTETAAIKLHRECWQAWRDD
jgi:hypothetical protein